MPRYLMGADETAQYLGTTPGTLRTWRYRRMGPPYIKLVSGIRYDRAHVDRWLDAQSRQPQGA